ncbi:MAG: HAMP domain-containing histidine kinase [Eubacteriales bacterium]|nr:HAMP domain-containing histidine kinase [Eubacteriales bacterium]
MTFWYTLLTFLTVVAFSCALYLMTSYVLNEMLERDVSLSMQQIIAQIEDENGLLTFENEVPISKNTMYFITEANGSELASYGGDITLLDSIPVEPDVYRTVQSSAERWLLLDSGVITVDRFQIRIRVANSLSSNDRVLSTMLLVFLISIPLIVLLSMLGGQLIARRSLAPIGQIIHSADRIARGDMTARIPAAPSRDELGELTDTLNRMLQSVEATFMREKRFTSDASHELRTPVAVLRAYTESLRAEVGTTMEQKAELNIMLAECVRMQKIISQLLTITRGQEGQYPLCMEAVDLHAVAEGVAGTLAERLCQKGTSLAVTVPENLLLYADQSLMTEMLLNLAENALQYGKPGGHIDLRASRESEHIVIQVQDDGVGIPQDALPHIFERFYRVDSARDRSGTGLGLSIVDWIVKAHHGTLSVESKLGEGTVFTVTLPQSGNGD